VKIVDVGSLTQAADVLHVAQPALSQQVATLEAEVHQRLLVRSKLGVVPTQAGRVLYRHAQLILRQCEQAQLDIPHAPRAVKVNDELSDNFAVELPHPRTLDLKTHEAFGVYTRRIYKLLGME